MVSLADAILDALLRAKRQDADAALIEALDALAERRGENRFRYGASIIRGTVLGRTAIDDREALLRIAAYPSHRQREAVGAVAGEIANATGERADSIARRLRRKLSRNETDKKVLSACPRV
ncbi:hypothetical protein HAP47_0020595 [Bradyrhizobium sp. 41S5]|uniref:hypothetical protein n=1 Tax=Bradyrhizobium sp. 41S5 TaxID=1404443 RepID=UPI00156AF8AD|nr:hypothetical protein [Bradyrhizobium sp. 41S5]UFX41713.1 hypothetical protein HAP47_0020595 [Bradyrhizobium sp. 41S5]